MIAFDQQLHQYTRDEGVEIMLRLQAGDLNALGELANKFSGQIAFQAHEILGANPPVEDIHQEVLLRVLRSRDNYVPTAKFSTWLSSITRNYLLNLKRDVARRRTIPVRFGEGHDSHSDYAMSPPLLVDDQLAKIIREEEDQQVQDAVENLLPRHRDVITLVYFEGMSYDQAAAKMKISTMAVKSILVRARKRILSLLKTAGCCCR